LGPGDKLGKYDLIRQIAIGGMAELYLARTVGIEGFEKLVVIKRILPQFASNASFVTMFTNEARLAAQLQHPNVTQVYDIGVEAGDYFFAMEYVHGEDLERLTAQAFDQGVPLSLDAALTLIAGLCAGLHYAHEKIGPDGKPLQIVHRDVSPSNVLVSYDGAVKLVDFGIARGGKPTTRGGLKGKISYMSPEQCRADAVLDRRSDIYSVGTLLYELTVGRMPFTGETEYAVLNQIVNADVPRPSQFVPGYPPALERILTRALSRDPAGRYPTALSLQGELEDFAHENRLRVSPLVLARLMGTLFPTRVEDWDHAKSQGAFFVEQHVVRTLIESGKTPDPNDPEIKEQIKEMTKQLASDAAAAEPTEIIDRTKLKPPPKRDSKPQIAAKRESAPELQPPPSRTPTPYPNAVPIYQAQPGVMVSHPGGDPYVPPVAYAMEVPNAVVAPASSQFDVTLRVPVKSGARRRGAVIGLTVIAAAAGGIAAMIAFGGGSSSVEVTPAVPMHVAAPAPAPAPVVAQPPAPPAPAPIVEQAPAPTPIVEAPPAPKPKPAIAKKPPSRPRPHVAKPKPEDKPAWDADSPFMPVRTDKH
jgi:serine/threonine protein kinase